MSEFCSRCEPKYHDLKLRLIAWELKRGEIEHFLCEGCDVRGIQKDKNGKLFLAHEKEGKLVWERTSYKKL